MSDIKIGVSLYSFSTEFIHEKLDFEGILKKAHDMGYQGVEIVAAQMVPEYPYPSDAWLAECKALLEKYELESVCWSAYIDMGIRSDRDLTEEEIIQFTVNDLIYAKKAGFPLVRTQHAISPKIFRQMIPFCKELGVKLTIEIHPPTTPRSPCGWILHQSALMLNTGLRTCEVLGLLNSDIDLERKVIIEAKEDFLKTLEICRQVGGRLQGNAAVRLFQDVLRLFAPLM